MTHHPLPTHSHRASPCEGIGRLRICLLVMATMVLSACASRQPSPAEPGVQTSSWTERQQAALEAAQLLPDEGAYQSHYFNWVDQGRQRKVQAKLYLPHDATPTRPMPLVVFSHGIGGSREGYAYLGKNWAAQGFASLHVQHAGSDNTLWSGSPLTLVARMQDAAQESEALNRVKDLRFALDVLLADGRFSDQLDRHRIVAAGHSYGANTVLLAAGAQVERDGSFVRLRDERIQAAIIISAPPFHGEQSPQRIVEAIGIPTLHITATGDKIAIPGYTSTHEDRIRLFEQTGSRHKTLVVFRDGSHSMFTDRLHTGGSLLNPKVKAATLDLTLAFLQAETGEQPKAYLSWPERHRDLLARYTTTLTGP